MTSSTNSIYPMQYCVLKVVSCNDNEPVKGKIWLQKLTFLTFMNFPEIFDESMFQKDKLGPYSDVVRRVSEDLQNLNFLIKKQEGFVCNSKGKQAVEEFERKNEKLIPQLDRFNEICEQIKADFNNFSRKEILAFVYKEFPIYRELSLVEKDLNYEEIFIKMYKDGKLGISKIAELLGRSVEETYKFLERNR